MMLTVENYHLLEANMQYLSASQYKDFRGSAGLFGCEDRALAIVKGYHEKKRTTAMTVSSYVDAHFAGTLDLFIAKSYPEILRKDGELKALFKRADEIINRIERDDYFMKYMAGQKQVIMTGFAFGCEWKIMIDSYVPGTAAVDMKVMKSLREAFWVKDLGRMSFVEYYGYDIQAAIYRKVIEANTGQLLPFYIAGASKEEEPDIEIIGIDERTIRSAEIEIERNVPRILDLKAGKIQPDRCGKCDWCRRTKKLTKPIHFSELIGDW